MFIYTLSLVTLLFIPSLICGDCSQDGPEERSAQHSPSYLEGATGESVESEAEEKPSSHALEKFLTELGHYIRQYPQPTHNKMTADRWSRLAIAHHIAHQYLGLAEPFITTPSSSQKSDLSQASQEGESLDYFIKTFEQLLEKELSSNKKATEESKPKKCMGPDEIDNYELLFNKKDRLLKSLFLLNPDKVTCKVSILWFLECRQSSCQNKKTCHTSKEHHFSSDLLFSLTQDTHLQPRKLVRTNMVVLSAIVPSNFLLNTSDSSDHLLSRPSIEHFIQWQQLREKQLEKGLTFSLINECQGLFGELALRDATLNLQPLKDMEKHTKKPNQKMKPKIKPGLPQENTASEALVVFGQLQQKSLKLSGYLYELQLSDLSSAEQLNQHEKFKPILGMFKDTYFRRTLKILGYPILTESQLTESASHFLGIDS